MDQKLDPPVVKVGLPVWKKKRTNLSGGVTNQMYSHNFHHMVKLKRRDRTNVNDNPSKERRDYDFLWDK